MSAEVVKFPTRYRSAFYGVDPNREPAPVIVLPVVRIERNPDNPHDAMVDEFARQTGRRRRRYRRGELTAAEIARLAKDKGV